MDFRIVVGAEVILRPTRKGNNTIVAKISKVGKKWFYVKVNDWYEAKFDRDTIRQDCGGYSADYALYFSAQEMEDIDAANDLYRDIHKRFDGWSNTKYTLDQLRRINAILQEDNNANVEH